MSKFSLYIVFLLVLPVVCFLIYFYWKRRAIYRYAATISGVPGTLPLIGNALYFWNIPGSDLLRHAEYLSEQYSCGSRFWFGPFLILGYKSPESIQQILTSKKTQHKSFVYSFLKPGFGNGLITSSGARWRTHRKIINSTMTSSILQSYVYVFSKQSRVLADQLNGLVGKPTFNIFKHVASCTTDIICETIMGIESNIQKDNNGDFLRNIDILMKITHLRMYRFWLLSDFIFKYSKYYHILKSAKESVYQFLASIIKEKRKIHENAESTNMGQFSTLEKLIDVVSQSDAMNEQDVFDEMLTLFIAGQEPLATISCVVLWMMGMKKNIQEKVHEELDTIFEGSTRPVEYSDLQKMTYLEMVIKEAQRLYPVTVFFREVTEDFELNNKIIPAGCNILMSPYITHRMKEHWGPHPEVFDPDNFLPDRVAQRHPYAYFPFSGGMRSCAGKDYAILALKTIVAEVARRYVFISEQKEEDIKMVTGVTTRPKGGFKVKIEERIR